MMYDRYLMKFSPIKPASRNHFYIYFSALFLSYQKMKPGTHTNNSAVGHKINAGDNEVITNNIIIGDSETNYDEEYPPMSKSKSKRRTRIDLRTQPAKNLSEKSVNAANSTSQEDETGQQMSYRGQQMSYRGKHLSHPNSFRQASSYTSLPDVPRKQVKQAVIRPFNICNGYNSKSLMPGETSLHMGTHIDIEYPITETRQILRPGMVLLTNYISLCEQANIINRCRDLGHGPGGFYQPGYQDGAKLRLQMMCLGKRWDPVTKYKENSQSDGLETLGIPAEFVSLVDRALSDAHFLINKNEVVNDAEEMLPRMFPDICIVNFYTTTGKLGLHQDRDESKDSLHRGLPVVSVSLGDSAEFLYGDTRDKTESILLKSGDVLIFGGKSRHIYHGVASVNQNSAPPALLKGTNLRPGRLNLTFRQF